MYYPPLNALEESLRLDLELPERYTEGMEKESVASFLCIKRKKIFLKVTQVQI